MRRVNAIRRVVICGGGTAGWMTAAALSKEFDGQDLTITLVESDEIGTVGVGEATIPGIHTFNLMLGLDQAEFMRECKATFKLGVEFVDWGRIGARYMHSFTRYGKDLKAVAFHQMWLRQKLTGYLPQDGSIDDYNLGAVAAKANRFRHPVAGEKSEAGALNYAFHFDASLYAKYLRRYAEKRRVMRTEGRIQDVILDTETGFIRSVALENGKEIEGDLFIDATGFRGLLIGQALGVGYDNWSHYLPCDRAVAVACEGSKPLLPYTRSTADMAGWRWRIPLRHRVGNGYVYSSAFLDQDAAEERLLAKLDGPATADPRHLRFTTGRRHRSWERNCVAIGLSAGFLEPLESTSIHLIQTAILRLLAYFPDTAFEAADIDTFNRLTRAEYLNVRDFLILHYKLTTRDDDAFWRHCRDMAVPESLEQAIALFASRGRVVVSNDQLFTLHSWTAVLIGQGLLPRDFDPLAGKFNQAEIDDFMASYRRSIMANVASLPEHEAYLGSGLID